MIYWVASEFDADDSWLDDSRHLHYVSLVNDHFISFWFEIRYTPVFLLRTTFAALPSRLSGIRCRIWQAFSSRNYGSKALFRKSRARCLLRGRNSKDQPPCQLHLALMCSCDLTVSVSNICVAGYGAHANISNLHHRLLIALEHR